MKKNMIMRNTKILLVLFWAAWSFVACNLDPAEDNKTQVPDKEEPTREVVEIELDSLPPDMSWRNSADEGSTTERRVLAIDQFSTATAKFIAGIPTIEFRKLQEKPFYQQHVNQVQQAWSKTDYEDLEPIRTWISNNNITGHRDYNATLFYPFSGPDILYAKAFFPYCRRYVLVGLEKAGTLPNLNNIPENLLKQYLENIRASQRYINKVGYFTTKQMQRDFSQHNLNGTIHLLLYYLARTRHKIVNVSTIYIDKTGNQLKRKAPGTVKALRIDFTDPARVNLQTLYYLRFDLANPNMQRHPQFFRFLKQSEKMITYVKSGSYILHDSHFGLLRDFILANSSKILQDDTGIPYWKFKQSPFELQLFGNYSSTIKDFKNHFQPSLKTALDEQGNKGLPFTVGYNSWLNETLLMYATRPQERPIAENTPRAPQKKQPEPKTDPADNTGLVFKVQIKMSTRYFKPNDPVFNGLDGVSYYMEDGAYKYTIGNAASSAACTAQKQRAYSKGFHDAFIVAFLNGKRIPVQKAVQMER